MARLDIINTIGQSYLTINLEKDGEFSYVQAGIPLSEIPKNKKGEQNFKLDIRFEDTKNNLSILAETLNANPSKKDIFDHEEKLLNSYCLLESKLRPEHNIILILAHSDASKRIKVWMKKRGEEIELLPDTEVKTFSEYEKYFTTKYVNNEVELKVAVLELNELLHKNGIKEDTRGQFVGTCLLALKSPDFIYKLDENSALDTNLIIQGIRNVICSLLDSDSNKIQKIALLDTKVLNNQKIRNLKKDKFKKILDFILEKIIPYINTDTNKGQDLLNLFFTTFNKYVGKKDKNQAFTPDHITHFMCKVAEVNKNSKVLDPTCGSGSFIVQALIQELYECNTDAERGIVRKQNIFGIENEEKAFGLSTTNMLIHGDGNSNILLEEQQGCFALRNWIREKNIDIVLMNPPYNAQPIEIPKLVEDESKKDRYTIQNWNKKQLDGKTEPTKGFCFVNYIADCMGKDKEGKIRKGMKLLCLLPLPCATGSKDIIKQEKIKILQNNTLDAVFTLPSEMFYPGASVNACCMVFTIGIPHFTINIDDNGKEHKVARKETFLGYYKDDGFIKRKNLGRISKSDDKGISLWSKIEKEWLDLYYGNISNKYKAIRRKVSAEDEWLAEAYIETDYSLLSEKDFRINLQKFFAYLVGNGYDFYSKVNKGNKVKRENLPSLKTEDWNIFKIEDLFNIELSSGDIKKGDCPDGDIPLISSGSLNNGVVEYIDENGDGKAKIFNKNKITVDMFGQAFYQPDDFYSVSHGRINILTCKNSKFNRYSALFICTIINNEKYRFSYNRAVYSNVISNLEIKLPTKKLKDEKGNITYEPDWQFMEDYIKSLPYADLI